MKYEPQVSVFTTKFWTFYGLKVHIPGKMVVYVILISTLPVLKGKNAGKFVREALMEKATIKPVASLLPVQKYFSRNWSFILFPLPLINGPFLVSGFV